MGNKIFKSMLAPNQQLHIEELPYPLLASYKLDGCRLIIKNGELLTRSLKQLQNKQLREKFEPLRKYTEDNQCVLDGEIYAPDIPFQFIVSCFMTQDYNDKTAIKKWEELCKNHEVNFTREEVFNQLKFYCFDNIKSPDEPFILRLETSETIILLFSDIAIPVKHIICNNKEEAKEFFKQALDIGHEGLILRSSGGKYKYGRGTLKEGLIFKLKPYVTFDAKIIDVIQATKVDPNAEKKTNELGRSVTSKKKEDRILIEKASAFKVMYKGHELKPVIAMTDSEKEEIWKNKDKYIGKWIEYKGMQIGAKDVPRHPMMQRFREDKD